MAAPLYQQIRREIEGKIHAGELAPGARLPTESELRSQYGVSRATAQRALNELAGAGLAVRRRRHGTFVADMAARVNLLNFVAPEVAEKGAPGRHEVISARVARADDAILALPGTAPDTAVVELVRRKLDERDRPHSVERHIVLFSIASDLMEQDLAELVSMRYFRGKRVPIATVRLYIDAVNLDDNDAALLDSEPGTASLLRRREARFEDGNAIEIVETIIRPGTAQFFVELPSSAG